jgi:type II secretory pathway pseudopilin PulG
MITKLKHRQVWGFTLVESVVGMVVFLVASSALVPVLATYRLTTIRNDIRIGAVAVAQQVMDTLRQTDIASIDDANSNVSHTVSTLPLAAGGTSLSSLAYKGKTYAATITFCDIESYCSTSSKHIKVKVYPNGNTATAPIFELETVYSRLQ